MDEEDDLELTALHEVAEGDHDFSWVYQALSKLRKTEVKPPERLDPQSESDKVPPSPRIGGTSDNATGPVGCVRIRRPSAASGPSNRRGFEGTHSHGALRQTVLSLSIFSNKKDFVQQNIFLVGTGPS